MKKTFFELRRNSGEIWGCVEKAIYHGCVSEEQLRSYAVCGGEVVERFSTKDEALDALAKRSTTIREYGYHFFFVEEFFVEENVCEIDEDGEEDWIDGGDIWGYSTMPEELLHDHAVYRWNVKFERYEVAESR